MSFSSPRGIDVDGSIGHGNPEAAVGISRQNRPGTGITAQFGNAGKGVAGEYGGHPRVAFVAGGNQPVRLPVPGRGQPLQVEGGDGRLVRQRDQHAFTGTRQLGNGQTQ